MRLAIGVVLLALARGAFAADPKADVVAVRAVAAGEGYQFAVTVASPDTGCRRYADWWEVLSEEGRLLYRRILFHSHADEQPFTRSGGPVPVGPDTVVWVRAHMHPGGYGGRAMRGSVNGGFRAENPPSGFGEALGNAAPLPEGCAF